MIFWLSGSLNKHINQQYLPDVIFFFSLPWIQSYDGMPTRLQEDQCYILSRYDSAHNWLCVFCVPVYCDRFFDIYDLDEWILSTELYLGKHVEATFNFSKYWQLHRVFFLLQGKKNF